MASFKDIAYEARSQNGWEPIGIIVLPANNLTLPGGIIVFDRMTGTETSYGTAGYVEDETGRISFHRGHYDLSYKQALEDFAKRIARGH